MAAVAGATKALVAAIITRATRDGSENGGIKSSQDIIIDKFVDFGNDEIKDIYGKYKND